MNKRLALALTLVFLAAGFALAFAAVAASQAFSNVLIIPAAQKEALLARFASAPAGQLFLFRWNYAVILAGLALAGAGFWFLRTFNRHSERSRRVTKLLLTEYRPLVILVATAAVFAALSSRFFTVGNFTNILKQISHYAILAAGVYFAILLGGIDISVGSVLAFSGAMAALIISRMPASPWSAALAVLAALAIGMAAGFFNGFFIARFRLQPMIVTLATLSIFRGATLVLIGGAAVSIAGTRYAGAPVFNALGQATLLGGYLPVPIILMAAVFAVVYFVLNHTAFGRHMYAIGGNEEASLLSGIDVVRTKMLAYTASGLMAGIAGIIITARVASATPTAGQSYEMDAIAAVVIGGTSLRGGEGKVLYTIVGALIIGMLNNIQTLMGVDSYFQTIIKGAVILLAVLLDARTGRNQR
ncbi:MAG TPA: ribose ABC transporter permease [Candidatus Limnocylindria bacterium]|nr:ribose ABC transporter permease [Candidatus Limnocylindria bacterium]